MPSAIQPKSSPFDFLAPVYDDLFTNSKIGRAQRQAVWSKLEEVFQPGNKILEINCGTGVDAVYLARMGVRVLALDSSAGMIATTERRIDKESIHELVTCRQLAIEELGQLKGEGPFDGVLSNFGGLNCVSDLQQIGRNLARLLKPGSPALLCLMGHWCVWEMFYYLSRFQPKKALRRTARRGALVELRDTRFPHSGAETLSGGFPSDQSFQLRVHYPTVTQLSKALAPSFIRRSYQAIGLVVPPSYLEPWISEHPRFHKVAVSLDGWISRWPGLRNLGDHYLVEMERT
jgi:ubiquinone/menaquinone biosynthesis C-methylase UbiE